MGQGDYAYAAKMRDVIRKIVVNVLNQERPRYRYGTVQTIDRANRKCTVTFGDDTANPVTVTMGSIQPAANGQIVRVAGLSGDKFIDDVMGPVYLAVQLASTTTAPAAGVGQALPATPVGYLTLTVNGNLQQIAYY